MVLSQQARIWQSKLDGIEIVVEEIERDLSIFDSTSETVSQCALETEAGFLQLMSYPAKYLQPLTAPKRTNDLSLSQKSIPSFRASHSTCQQSIQGPVNTLT